MRHVIKQEGRDEEVAVVVTLQEQTGSSGRLRRPLGSKVRLGSPGRPLPDFYFDGEQELTSWSLKTTGSFFLEQTAIRLSGSSWPADRNWSSRPWSMRTSS